MSEGLERVTVALELVVRTRETESNLETQRIRGRNKYCIVISL